MPVYLSNTNLLQLKDLSKETDGSAIVGAAVAVTVNTKAGAQLAGAAWPQNMIDIGGGDYELSLPPALAWVEGGEYVAVIDATTPAGMGHWEYHFKAQRRTTS
jgi:hypothetical protein